MNINKNIVIYVLTGLVLSGLLYKWYKKDNYLTVSEQERVIYDNTFRPHSQNLPNIPLENNDIITKTELVELFKSITQFANGAPKGANTNTAQNDYDLIFKDIIVSSDKRNQNKYPNPNDYSVELNFNIDRIYKAELIDVYIPAATDDSVNIPVDGNRLYFTYSNSSAEKSIDGYVIIQPGTYMSPESIAGELGRQFCIVLSNAGFDTCQKHIGVCVVYNKNLNRYIFKDKNQCIPEQQSQPSTLIIYPKNGYSINMDISVQNSIASYLMLNYEGPAIYSPYNSGAMFINQQNGVLFVDYAVLGDYGQWYDGTNITNVPLNRDSLYSNCIISDVVLTNCKLYLSLDKLNGDTCNIITYQNEYNPGIVVNNVNAFNGTYNNPSIPTTNNPQPVVNKSSYNKGNVPKVFCQIPNNTCISSSSVKTLLNQPTMFSCIQFYNPPINKLNKLSIKWYTEDGALLRILDHCFTLRIHYFQKRMAGTDFSYQIR
jgi:hypothetical protein